MLPEYYLQLFGTQFQETSKQKNRLAEPPAQTGFHGISNIVVSYAGVGGLCSRVKSVEA